jgi:hypothetical protein
MMLEHVMEEETRYGIPEETPGVHTLLRNDPHGSLKWDSIASVTIYFSGKSTTGSMLVILTIILFMVLALSCASLAFSSFSISFDEDSERSSPKSACDLR